tara:strand:+ start:309 stop:782 length:474 start_codon:yes stop_codon:yes gene_type:complete
MSRPPITAQGAQRLRDELKTLKGVERPKIIKEIAEARAHGDLKENAEYHAAKERQGFIEGRIADIESTVSNAEIIDVQKLNAGGKIVFGATVDLINIDSGEEVTYQIVGEMEADISASLISVTSPTARALIGKQEGDEVVVNAPAGELVYEIAEVRY